MTARARGAAATGGGMQRNQRGRRARAGANGAARAKPNGAGQGAAPPVTRGLELLPVIQKDTTHPCFECAQCCRYIAVEIDPPTTMTEYDYIVWYLYHGQVSVFVDWDGAWFVKFDSRCENLTPQGLCGVYETRPAICRDFDWRDCERHLTDEPPDKWLFESAAQFLAWLEKQRPRTFRRFQAFQRERAREKTARELRRLKITELALPVPPPAR